MSLALIEKAVEVAVRAARRAGALQAKYAGKPRSVETKRNVIDLVTEVDRASERIIHQAIARAFPDHGFRGEERTRTHPDAPYQWIVDPLDGTTNFVHGVPCFAVSIGLLDRGRVVAGVIYDPMRKETFSAIRGRGAWLNGRPMRVSKSRRLDQSMLSTGFSIKFREHPAPYLRWFTAFQMRCHAVRRSGSTAISLAYVACGRQEGFYEQDLWPWDLAAGLLLVQEAGGRVSDYRNRPVQLEQGEVLASNGRVHAAMLGVLAHPTRARGAPQASPWHLRQRPTRGEHPAHA